MGNVIKLHHGRAKAGARLPKPVECKECGEDVETARLQAIMAMNGGFLMHPVLCISCAKAREAREARILANAREDDVVIIRRR